MFGRGKMSFYECKQYLIQNLVILNPQLQNETSSTIVYSITQGRRVINIKLAELVKGIITIDVTDSFYLLRIPTEKFKDFQKYKNYTINLINQLAEELGLGKE